jgi:hypothetical protein
MAKILAGVMAVSIAALLFTGCGGGSSASSGDKQACALWNAMSEEIEQENEASSGPERVLGNSEAQRLKVIAESASDLQVTAIATALANLLERGAKTAGDYLPIDDAAQQMDAACAAIGQ